MNDQIPHWYGMGNAPSADSYANNDFRLRMGEVQASFPPEDPRNSNGRRTEYDVWVGRRSNGTATGVIYSHCVTMDKFGSQADRLRYTLRNDKSATRKPLQVGVGSKVLILCINSESTNPIIIGGIADPVSDPDDPADGHHLDFEFNGVGVSINRDGEFELSYGGATTADGSLTSDVDTKAVGTFVKITQDGNLLVSDVGGANSVLIDHANDRITIKSDKEIDVVADTVRHGSATASQPAVLGDKWVSLMSDLLTAIEGLTHSTAVGPTSPPLNIPAFEAIRAQLQSILSDTVFNK